MNDLYLSALARERGERLRAQAREARSVRAGAACPHPLRSLFASVFAWVGSACYKLSDALAER
jgi:hypothetical protein